MYKITQQEAVMINFIVCGLENTLLYENKNKIDDRTIELISELNANGVKFAVATGRNYDAVKPLFGNVKNDIVYICNDGGVVIYQDKVISKTPIDRLVCMEVVSEIEKNDKCLPFICIAFGRFFMDRPDNAFFRESKAGRGGRRNGC